MNNAIFLRAPYGARSLFSARHTGTFLQVVPFFHPSVHQSIHPCACLAHYFRTIKVDFMLHGAFHHNGEASGMRERLVEGIFNSCHSYCLHLYVPCLLAQLSAPNMVHCWAKATLRKSLVHFNGIVLLCPRTSTVYREASQPCSNMIVHCKVKWQQHCCMTVQALCGHICPHTI